MPDLGIGEGLAALFGGGDLLGGIGSLLGFGEAAAPAVGAETGLASIGAGAADAGLGGAGLGVGAGAGGDLAAITGTGTGLFGGTTGLAGTALAGGADTAGLLGTGAATAGGTALDFLSAPGASGFNPATATPAGVGGETAFGGVSGALPSGVANANGAASVFDTGAGAVPGVNAAGVPSATTVAPPGASAASTAAPAGVAGVPDATSAAALNPAPGAAGPVAPAPTAPASSIDSLLGKLSPSNLASGAVDSLTKNPLGVALGAGGLGYSIYKGSQDTKNQKALTADAQTATANSNQMVQSGEALQQYLTNGTLPPAYQTQVDQAIKDAKTKAISNAAQQGLNTDPTQNTALATTLAQIDNQRGAMQTQVASQLFSSGQGLVNSGAQAAGLSGQLYQALVQNDTTQAANTGKAIAALAAALNGKGQASGSGTTVTIG